MGKRPTIRDLANAAGVSMATVDRVLNGRHKVRPETARRVYEAADRIDYHAVGLIRRRLIEDLPDLRFGFLLQKEKQAFFQDVARELHAAVERAGNVRGTSVVEFLVSQAPEEVIERLGTLAERVDVIAMVAPDHPSVTAAVQRWRDAGVPVFAMLSDFAPGVRDGYVGVDNRKAGRTAAWIIAQTATGPGAVALFVGTHRFHGHEEREIGFRSYFREHAPAFEVLETLVNAETRQVTEEATLSLLRRHADLTGLYVAGGGMEGAFAALREVNPRPTPRLVVSELTADSRAALADGTLTMAMSTPLRRLGDTVVQNMIQAVQGGGDRTPGQVFLPFSIHLPESV